MFVQIHVRKTIGIILIICLNRLRQKKWNLSGIFISDNLLQKLLLLFMHNSDVT